MEAPFVGRRQLANDVLFKLDVVELLVVDNDVFSDAFHGVELLRLIVLDEVNFAKCAFSDHFYDLEIFEVGFLILLLFEHESVPTACPA